MKKTFNLIPKRNTARIKQLLWSKTFMSKTFMSKSHNYKFTEEKVCVGYLFIDIPK